MQVMQDYVQRHKYIILPQDGELVPWVHKEGIAENVPHHHKV